MGEVLNLNRFRKKKAREEKQKRAETNRRLHGRTQAQRVLEDAQKKKIEDTLGGAFLVRESVRMEDIPMGDIPGDFEKLEAAVEVAPDLSEISRRLRALHEEAHSSQKESGKNQAPESDE